MSSPQTLAAPPGPSHLALQRHPRTARSRTGRGQMLHASPFSMTCRELGALGDFVGDRLHSAPLQVDASVRPTTGLACSLSQTALFKMKNTDSNINQVRGVETTSHTSTSSR